MVTVMEGEAARVCVELIATTEARITEAEIPVSVAISDNTGIIIIARWVGAYLIRSLNQRIHM